MKVDRMIANLGKELGIDKPNILLMLMGDKSKSMQS
jgi:hypothetical protein